MLTQRPDDRKRRRAARNEPGPWHHPPPPTTGTQGLEENATSLSDHPRNLPLLITVIGDAAPGELRIELERLTRSPDPRVALLATASLPPAKQWRKVLPMCPDNRVTHVSGLCQL
jgi:hypothetical protein